MSEIRRSLLWLNIVACLAMAAGLACADSSSNNWNKLFGDGDRRAEPAPPQTADAGAEAGAPRRNPAPETSTHEWAESGASQPDEADRGDPAAIEQYAANVNPPADGAARVQSSRPPSPSTGDAGRGEPGEPGAMNELDGGDPSPVRTAANRPVNPWATRSDAPVGSETPDTPVHTASGGTNGDAAPTNNTGAGNTGAPRLNSVTVQPVAAGAPRGDTTGDAGGGSSSLPAASNDSSATASVESAQAQRQRDVAAQEARVAADPTNIEEQFKLRTMYLFDGRDEDALAPIKGVTPDVEEIVLGQLRSMQATRSGNSREPATWANRQLEALSQLQEKLRARADLQVPKVVLCTEIVKFGDYTPFASNEFAAGSPHDVLIYVEVDNFESKPTSGGEYRTRLAAKLSLLGKDGAELVSIDEPNIEDFSRGVRRDFFLAFGPITIPATLPVGDYVVKVEIQDMNAGKINSNQTELRLVP